ncbi:MAG: hypothetical protein M3463_10655 [Verrucomicrobiota bacterium]|nr:hypothetical protein [Verrucomicrobiota bacterium]
MNMTIKTALAAVAASIVLPCTFVSAQDAATSVQASTTQSDGLEGRWEGVEGGGKCTMKIAGNSIHFQGSTKDEWYKATFTLRSEMNPKQLVARITECSAPEFVGKSSLAIYKIEDGTLTLVGREPGAPDAPKGFNGDAASRSFVFKKTEPQKQNTKSPEPK